MMHAKYNTNGGQLDNQTEGLIVVDVGMAGRSLEQPIKPCGGKRAIEVKLVLEYPLARHDISVGWVEV